MTMLKKWLIATISIVALVTSAQTNYVQVPQTLSELGPLPLKWSKETLNECVKYYGEEGCPKALEQMNRIYRAYSLYIVVKWCHDVREGYLVRYLNDVELRRAEEAVKAVVQQAEKEVLMAENETDILWDLADQNSGGVPITLDLCQHQFYPALLAMSPKPSVSISKPTD